jgi:conjugal transfer mating pair stabilization protein TraG
MQQATNSSRASHDARHDMDAKATQDFKEASDYFTSRKVSESGSHTDNNAASRADQLSASLNSAKQSYDQYTPVRLVAMNMLKWRLEPKV